MQSCQEVVVLSQVTSDQLTSDSDPISSKSDFGSSLFPRKVIPARLNTKPTMQSSWPFSGFQDLEAFFRRLQA